MDLPANNEVYVQIISDITSGIGNEARKSQLIGMQDRPDYILVGQLQEISESNDRVRDSFYKLTMRLVNLQTFKFDWAEENDIRKVQTRARFGY
jgi:TolB-like protein